MSFMNKSPYFFRERVHNEQPSVSSPVNRVKWTEENGLLLSNALNEAENRITELECFLIEHGYCENCLSRVCHCGEEL